MHVRPIMLIIRCDLIISLAKHRWEHVRCPPSLVTRPAEIGLDFVWLTIAADFKH